MAELYDGPSDPVPHSIQYTHEPQGESSGGQAALLHGMKGAVSVHHLFDVITWEKPATCPPPLCCPPYSPNGVCNPV